jgi:hypothetical protein
MMTRKDYVVTAEILNDKLYALGNSSVVLRDVVEEIAKDFADYFEEDNPRFNRERFMQAVKGN